MAELSEERKAQFEKAWEEAQLNIEAATDAYDICEIIASLDDGATLIDFGPEKSYCGWYREDGSPISWPDRRTVKVMEHIKYISPERVTGTRGRPALRYVLTDKARRFLASRGGRLPQGNENFYTILDKRSGDTEVYIYVGKTAPSPREVVEGVVEDTDDRVEVHGPHDWNYVYADAYDLSREEVKSLEAQPI